MTSLPLPKHIAIIMDGNGRWAKKRFMPRVFGHRAALKRIKEILRYLSDNGGQALTLYAFSTENWKRPKTEVSFLMNLVIKALKDELEELHQNNVVFRTIGDTSGLPVPVQDALVNATTLMGQNTGICFNIALNYGGRAEILKATREIAVQVQAGECTLEEITEENFSNRLYTAGLPDPDLMIRTGGEHRLSNFLLWQNAYAEFYFTDILFPDFGLKELHTAIDWFNSRERRYGMISEQLSSKK